MGFLEEKCQFRFLSEEVLQSSEPFDCGEEDLNDFFINESIDYAKQLIGKSYCFTLKENCNVIVCAFTVSNDSISTLRLPNSRGKRLKKEIPYEKRSLRRYPAVLIGRLGVNRLFHGYKYNGAETVGDELMKFILTWFSDPLNKTGCRFAVVDSYNTELALRYYVRNKFEYLFSTETQERSSTNLSDSEELRTRLLYFDLVAFSS